jgi:methanogenic corrinoid protein MtbC1
MNGWNVTFLGANTPEADLLDMLRTDPPDLLGISVSMVFNLKHVRNLVAQIRGCPELSEMKILIGGQGTAGIESLWQATGADGWAGNGRDAVEMARQWWKNKVQPA